MALKIRRFLAPYAHMADVFGFSALARFIVEVVFPISGQYKYGTTEERIG